MIFPIEKNLDYQEIIRVNATRQIEINIIAAVSYGDVIGNEGKIPWHCSADLKRFKELTTGYPVIMGRHTFDSIGRALPNRTNIVISRSQYGEKEGVKYTNNPDMALHYAMNTEADKVWIIGGADIYNYFIDMATHLYLTSINTFMPGDTFFSNFSMDNWELIDDKLILDDKTVNFNYAFKIFKRIA